MDFTSQLTTQSGTSATCPASHFNAIARDGGTLTPVPDNTLWPDVHVDELAVVRAAERTRIAQELHDTLLQGFLGVSLQLHAAVDRLPSEYADMKRFTDILQQMNQVLEEGRFALQGLRSPNSQVESLGEAFSRVPKDLGLSSAVGFRVVVLGKVQELKSGLLDQVYRIGREAILNACRHSQANEIEAEVEYRPAELRIAVRDNGCGISPEDLQFGRIGHWGLRGMRERAERIGARLRLWSRVALGTEVELCVPARLAFNSVDARVMRLVGVPYDESCASLGGAS